MKGTIALLTDFGSKGQHYVASMKAVILNINPEANIIDISHNITPFSIIEASYIIRSIYKLFPENTVFIIVVDPGVGGKREILAIKSKSKHVFIGPNNGIFYNILKEKDIIECMHVKNPRYFHQPLSNTFHGRDIMAPVGAHLTNLIPLKEFGSRFDFKKIKELEIPFEANTEDREIIAIIQYIDSFGNAVTSIPIRNDFIKGTELIIKQDSLVKLMINDKSHQGKYVSHFGSEPKNTLVFLTGSTGFLEISKNQANAALDLGLKVGDLIKIQL